jgi:hypothetical protein
MSIRINVKGTWMEADIQGPDQIKLRLSSDLTDIDDASSIRAEAAAQLKYLAIRQLRRKGYTV